MQHALGFLRAVCKESVHKVIVPAGPPSPWLLSLWTSHFGDVEANFILR